MTKKTSTTGKSTRGGTRRSSTRKTTTTRRRSATSKRKNPSPTPSFRINVYQKTLIVGIVGIFFAAVLILSMLSPSQGSLTQWLSDGLLFLFGWGGYAIPIALGIFGFYLVFWGMEQAPQLPAGRVVGILLLFFTFEAMATEFVLTQNNAVITSLSDVWQFAGLRVGGGLTGGFIVWLFAGLLGTVGALFLYLVVGIIGVVLLSGITRQDIVELWQQMQDNRRRRAAQRQMARDMEPSAESSAESPIPTRRRRPVRTAQPVAESVTDATDLDEDSDFSAEPTTPPPPVINDKRKSRSADPAPAAAPEPIVYDSQGAGYEAKWDLPQMSDMLVVGSDPEMNNDVIREQARIIEHTLASFGAPGKIVDTNFGPTVTQFGVEPMYLESRSGKRMKVKVSKIAGLADDLALALAAKSVRIQAPVPGKGYIGIEVPNPDKVLVSLRDVMESPEYLSINSPLRIGLGQDVAGRPIAADLTKMPHLLIAGATGSGKSICVNSIIACLLLQNTPDDLRLVMVDPKRVELTGYNGVPHLAAPVVVDMERVPGVLSWSMKEMDKRYDLFAKVGTRNIGGYNRKALKEGKQKLPYIVVIVDELADLMMTAPEQTEKAVARLAQMARATGIHLILSTQRPSVDVVTGLIKANFPARIAFAVASATDSRVVLDSTGAERLLGQGDMLFQMPDKPAPARMQGCFVSDEELNKLINYWKTARRFHRVTEAAAQPRSELTSVTPNGDAAQDEPISAETSSLPEPTPIASSTVPATPPPSTVQQPLLEDLIRQEQEAANADPVDELMPEVIDFIRQSQKASTSMLQRRFRIGYTRSARIMDALEDQGIIGPPTGTSKARKVLIPKTPADPELNSLSE
ncbi:MAG: DNA translocase FtsK [Anaerolineae bacterium]|nr:DNA translocase FtsK [Anaerolineae bacterium]